MGTDKKVITLGNNECSELVSYLMEARNQRIEEGKPTDRVNDLVLKIIDSPIKDQREPERAAR